MQGINVLNALFDDYMEINGRIFTFSLRMRVNFICLIKFLSDSVKC